MQCGLHQNGEPTAMLLDPETSSNTNRPDDAMVNCFGRTIDIDKIMDILNNDDGGVNVSRPDDRALPDALAASTKALLQAPATEDDTQAEPEVIILDDDTQAEPAAITLLRPPEPLLVDTGATPPLPFAFDKPDFRSPSDIPQDTRDRNDKNHNAVVASPAFAARTAAAGAAHEQQAFIAGLANTVPDRAPQYAERHPAGDNQAAAETFMHNHSGILQQALPRGAINFYDSSAPFYEFTNFYLCPNLVIDGRSWWTAEQYFQAMKFSHMPWVVDAFRGESARRCFELARSPRLAPLVRSDWHSTDGDGNPPVKDQVMLKALRAKFDDASLGDILISTCADGIFRLLVEHTEHDSYWGDGGVASWAYGMPGNRLGQLLMQVRDEIQRQREPQAGPRHENSASRPALVSDSQPSAGSRHHPDQPPAAPPAPRAQPSAQKTYFVFGDQHATDVTHQAELPSAQARANSRPVTAGRHPTGRPGSHGHVQPTGTNPAGKTIGLAIPRMSFATALATMATRKQATEHQHRQPTTVTMESPQWTDLGWYAQPDPDDTDESTTADTPELERLRALATFGADTFGHLHTWELGTDDALHRSSHPAPLPPQSVGVPTSPLPQVSVPAALADPERLQSHWCDVPRSSGHPAKRFADSLVHCRERKGDAETYSSPTTDHIPIMHSHTEQRAIATAGGGVFSLELGPSQFGPFDNPPKKWADLYVDPQASCYEAASMIKDTAQQVRKMQARGNAGPNRFDFGAVRGGKDGVHWDQSAVKPEYRRVQWRNIAGVPTMVTPSLPDTDTDMNIDLIYRTALAIGAPDMAAISALRLYGIRTDLAWRGNSAYHQNYASAWENLAHLTSEWDGATTADIRSIGAASLEPDDEPAVVHPIGVVVQAKPHGKTKSRSILDPGAPRQARADMTSAAIRERADMAAARRILTPFLSAELYLRQTGTKGRPDEYSVNECIKRAATTWSAPISYPTIAAFGEAVDVLASSRIPVDIVADDFKSWYTQFPIAATERYFNGLLVSEAGLAPCWKGRFGATHLPELTNRLNWTVCKIIEHELRKKQQSFDWSQWPSAMHRRYQAFVAHRRAAGGTGDMFAFLPFFDDNGAACIRPFTATLIKTRYEVWRRFAMVIAPEKHFVMRFEDLATEALIGFEIHAKRRLRRLSNDKVAKYSADIDSILAAAAAHPRQLVNRLDIEQLLGRCIHAAETTPAIWTAFRLLSSRLTAQWYFKYLTRVDQLAVGLLRRIRAYLHTDNGVPLTSYEYRPGQDGHRCYIAYTDASRRTITFFGAGGGWFRMAGDDTIYFFCHRWPEDTVRRSNIGELELKTATIAAQLAHRLQVSLGSNLPFYFFARGDNSAASQWVLNSMSARSPGMRFLIDQRYQWELTSPVMSSSSHVKRDFNKEADALANEDIPAFCARILHRYPGSKLCRLQVPEEMASLDDMLNWTSGLPKIAFVAADGTRSDTSTPNEATKADRVDQPLT